MHSYAELTGVTICGCASSISPPPSFPPPETPDICLSTGSARSIVKRTIAFTTVIEPYKYTCNVDENLNPFADCLNTMSKVCNAAYIGSNMVKLNNCKDAVSNRTSQMNVYWQNVRKFCGQWNGFTGVLTSNYCADANKELQKNSYYLAPDPDIPGNFLRSYVTRALVNSVNDGLWNNTVFRKSLESFS